MGKGDQKSTRGKRVRGSYGKTRPRKASKSVLVVEKPVNILSQGDNTSDDDMVNLLKKYFGLFPIPPNSKFAITISINFDLYFSSFFILLI